LPSADSAVRVEENLVSRLERARAELRVLADDLPPPGCQDVDASLRALAQHDRRVQRRREDLLQHLLDGRALLPRLRELFLQAPLAIHE
jgi:hypothetical protein